VPMFAHEIPKNSLRLISNNSFFNFSLTHRPLTFATTQQRTV